MDAITQSAATTTTARQQSASVAQQDQPAEAVISSDFETFLKMLTAQLENQDPLNPLESQDFAVQLATFSNVEQQAKTNTLLTDMANRLGASDLSEMSQWIGREAQVSGTLPYTGAPITLDAQISPGAVSSSLIVENAAGREVARYPLDPQKPGPIVWNGLGTDGEAFSPGNYTFRVTNEAASGALPDGAVTAYVPVIEARTGPRGSTVVLEGGLEVSPDTVTALREAETPT